MHQRILCKRDVWRRQSCPARAYAAVSPGPGHGEMILARGSRPLTHSDCPVDAGRTNSRDESNDRADNPGGHRPENYLSFVNVWCVPTPPTVRDRCSGELFILTRSLSSQDTALLHPISPDHPPESYRAELGKVFVAFQPMHIYGNKEEDSG